MIETIIKSSVDLNVGVHPTALRMLFATGDANAHTINVSLQRGGAFVKMPSGAQAAAYYVRRTDDKTIVSTGSVSGNVVSVTLDAGCYEADGDFDLIVKAIVGKESSAVFYGYGTMRRSASDNLQQSGTNPLTLEVLLAKISEMEAATADGIAAAEEARNAGTQAVEDAQAAGAAAKATADAAAANALAAAESVRSMYYKKADAIIDDSPRAAVHELHAQGDYPLSVTLYGAGDAENGGGVSKATVHVGGKNLFDISKVPFEVTENSFYMPNNGYGCCIYTDKNGAASNIVEADGTTPKPGIKDMPYLAAGTYRLSATVTFDEDEKSKTLKVGTVEDDGTYTFIANIDDPASGGTFTLENPTRITIRKYDNGGCTISNLMLSAGASAVPFAAYDAASVELPLLPDGTPLGESDTAENWFASGCDKAITLDGSEAWVRLYAADYPALVVFIQFTDAKKSPMYYTRDFYRTSTAYTNMRDRPGCFRVIAGTEKRIAFAVDAALCPTLDAWKAWLANNPQTVYYTSKEYTPENELRLARVVRGGTYTYGDAGIPLYKPDTLDSDTVTVTGSGDTAVSYAHDTKHYIDEKFAALSAALIGG